MFPMYASDTQSPLRLMSSGPHYDHAYDPALNETHVGYWTTVWIDPVLNETYAGYWLQTHVIQLSSTELLPAIGL